MSRPEWLAIACALLGLAGCAAAPRGPSQELVAARRTMARATWSPAAYRAVGAMAEAEEALARAESEAARAPGSRRAEDAAYVARRLAEKARLAGLYEVDREALAEARRTAERILQNVPRAREAAAERARIAAAMGPLPDTTPEAPWISHVKAAPPPPRRPPRASVPASAIVHAIRSPRAQRPKSVDSTHR